MTMPRVRLTVKTMMALVAIVGVGFYAALLFHRHKVWRNQSYFHRAQEQVLRLSATLGQPDQIMIELRHQHSEHLVRWRNELDESIRLLDESKLAEGESEDWKALDRSTAEGLMAWESSNWSHEESQRRDADRLAESAGQLRLAEYHGQLRRKYEYAAGHPWVSVAPDPPVPEDLRIHTLAIPNVFTNNRLFEVSVVLQVILLCLLLPRCMAHHRQARRKREIEQS